MEHKVILNQDEITTAIEKYLYERGYIPIDGSDIKFHILREEEVIKAEASVIEKPKER